MGKNKTLACPTCAQFVDEHYRARCIKKGRYGRWFTQDEWNRFFVWNVLPGQGQTAPWWCPLRQHEIIK